jgi:hypothetical protein
MMTGTSDFIASEYSAITRSGHSVRPADEIPRTTGEIVRTTDATEQRKDAIESREDAIVQRDNAITRHHDGIACGVRETVRSRHDTGRPTRGCRAGPRARSLSPHAMSARMLQALRSPGIVDRPGRSQTGPTSAPAREMSPSGLVRSPFTFEIMRWLECRSLLRGEEAGMTRPGVLCKGRDSSTTMLIAPMPGRAQTSLVRLTLHNPSGLCNVPQRPPPPPSFRGPFDHLPALHPPSPSVACMSSVGGPMTTTGIESSRPATEVLEHYAKQFDGAGWRRARSINAVGASFTGTDSARAPRQATIIVQPAEGRPGCYRATLGAPTY